LLPAEKLMVYYDETVSGDGSELALVTMDRVVYYKEGRTTAFPLADIAAVRQKKDPPIGDVIEVETRGGELMKIETSSSDDTQQLVSATEKARNAKRAPQ